MTEDNNLHVVKHMLNELNERFDFYQSCFEAHVELVTDESTQDAEQKRYDDKVSSIIHYRNDVTDWIASASRPGHHAHIHVHTDRPVPRCLIEQETKPNSQ